MSAAVRKYFDTADHGRFKRRIAAENEKYSWHRMVERIEEVFDQTSSDRRRKSKK